MLFPRGYSYNKERAKKYVLSHPEIYITYPNITEDDIVVKEKLIDMYEHLFFRNDAYTTNELNTMALNMIKKQINEGIIQDISYPIEERMVLEYSNAYATPYGIVHINQEKRRIT